MVGDYLGQLQLLCTLDLTWQGFIFIIFMFQVSVCGPERCHDSWFPGSNLVSNMRHFINYVRVRVPETAPEVKRDSPASTSSDSLSSLQVSVEERKMKRKVSMSCWNILFRSSCDTKKQNVVVRNFKLSFVSSVHLSNFCLTHLFPLICQNSRRPKVLQREVDVFDICINQQYGFNWKSENTLKYLCVYVCV